MTRLTKSVTRCTARPYAVLYQKARPIVVTMTASDEIEFKELGRRERWSLSIETAFKYAVRLKSFLDAGQKKRGRK